jgi:hypothetical protein
MGTAVIQKDVVYHKSAKGSEAIATRQHGLSPKLRSTLILIDGKRSFDELSKLAHLLGEPEQLLRQLLEQGFIEPVPEAAAPAGSGKAAAAPAKSNGIALLDAQRYASRRLFDLIGPTSEPACLRIEAARNAQDFQSAIRFAEVMVSDIRSSKVAADFAAEVQARMPPP